MFNIRIPGRKTTFPTNLQRNLLINVVVDLVAGWFGSWLITLELYIYIFLSIWEKRMGKVILEPKKKKRGQALLHSI